MSHDGIEQGVGHGHAGHDHSQGHPHDHAGHDEAHAGADDGVDRRGFLSCMAWAGTGMLWALKGGVLSSATLGRLGAGGVGGGAAGGMAGMAGAAGGLTSDVAGADLFFVQISDSHIGFGRDPNHDVAATLGEAIRRINGLPREPAFLLHTGDITQLSKPEEFDTAEQLIRSARTRTGAVHYVPGEHDVLDGTGRGYLDRYGKATKGNGWYSFDYQGVHFVGLVNVMDLKPGGLGNLGREQLEWLEKDLKPLSASTPIVVFAHVPLWTVYPAWGWGTDDSEQALGYLRRFGSVSVLNGHIHQVMQKVEGNVAFHTAMSTAFPQPIPGTAPSPGPMPVQATKLRDLLGLANITFVPGHRHLAVVDGTLSGVPLTVAQHEWLPEPGAAAAAAATGNGQEAPGTIAIANFTFSPAALRVRPGEAITFVNRDDTAHLVASSNNAFKASPGLDSGDRWALRLERAGTYPYFCALHPQMQGRIEVAG